MASADLLQTFLQLHLTTDAAAITSLPSIVSSLSSESLESSSHLVKWTNRVNALIHSREPGARWAGITLALHTSKLSRNVLISSAQGWVSTTLPMLSRSESSAVWKASIRLVAFIFTSTMDLAEFQRHVVNPNVPKFSSALISLAEKQADKELKVLCLDVLAKIVPLYPTLHRQLAPTLSTISLNFLNGSPTPTPEAIISSASRLHACLHTTGGKIGGAALWRKSVDETIVFCSASVAALRTTYVAEDQFVPLHTEPLISVPLNLDRLRCGVELLCHLLRATVARPVSVPIRSLVNLCIETLRVTGKGALRNDVDPLLRSMEKAAVSHILQMGCSLTDCLSRCVQTRLSPHLTRILDIVAYHLEQSTPIGERLPLIKLLPSLLGSCPPTPEALVSGRMVKAILPPIAGLLSQKSAEESSTMSADVGGKKGKKRARGYEGDEVFKVGRDTLCESALDGELVIAALDVLPFLLRVPNIPAYLQSLSSRLLLSLLLAVPKLPASSVAQDPTLKDKILRRVKSACAEFASGSNAVLCKSLPLVVDAITDDEVSCGNAMPRSSDQNMLLLDLMLHPRLPPLLRPLPSLDTVALCQSEESIDERTTRESLGLRSIGNGMDVDNEANGAVVSTSKPEAQQTVPADPTTPPTRSAADSPMPPVIIPSVPVRSAAPVVVQPLPVAPTIPPQASSSSAEAQDEILNASDTQNTTMAADALDTSPVTSPVPDRREGQETSTSMAQPARSASAGNIQPQSSRSSDSTRMIVDDEDDDDDIEMPVLNLESDTDSEDE